MTSFVCLVSATHYTSQTEEKKNTEWMGRDWWLVISNKLTLCFQLVNGTFGHLWVIFESRTSGHCKGEIKRLARICAISLFWSIHNKAGWTLQKKLLKQQHFVRNWHSVTCAKAANSLSGPLKEFLLSIKLNDFVHLQARKGCNFHSNNFRSRVLPFSYS